MILDTPLVIPVTLYRLDDFDLQLNWKERCGSTYDLTDYNAKLTFWPTKIDRTAPIYQLTNPVVTGTGILLSDTSPNLWIHAIDTEIDFDPAPTWCILELQTPAGGDPMIDGVWFRFSEGKVTYVV